MSATRTVAEPHVEVLVSKETTMEINVELISPTS